MPGGKVGGNLEIVRAAMDAWGRGDWDEALMNVSGDFEFDNANTQGEWRGVHRGPDQTKHMWARFVEPWESVDLQIDEVIEAGDRVVTVINGQFLGRDGIEVRTRQAWCWTFRDGKLTRVLASNDWADAFETAGLPPPPPSG